MRILMTTDTIGGVWTYALQLAEALQPHGVEIALATQGAALTQDQRAAADSLQNVRLHESEFRLEWMDEPWDDIRAAGDWLMELAATFSPDVVHLNEYSQAALPWKVPTVVVGHSCVCSWYRSVRAENAGPQWNRYVAAVQDGLRHADCVVAPTQTMLDWLQEIYGLLPRTRAIFNGLKPLPSHDIPREGLVFTAGRLWDEAKNISAVMRAADRLKWPVHAAGIPRPEPGPLTCESKNSAVRFLGRLSTDEMAVAYARASIYVLPARYEPFGLTPLEAALAGCVLVLGDIPTLREIWGTGALYVHPNDDDELVYVVNSLIDTPHLRNCFRVSALSRARELTAAVMADRYFDLYRELSMEASSFRIRVGGAA